MKKMTAAILTVLFLATSAVAQSTFTGMGDGSTWNDPLNWDFGVPFGVNANVGDGFDVTLSTSQGINELDLVGDLNAGTATLAHDAGTLTNMGWIKVGVNAGNDGNYMMSGTAQTNFGVIFMGTNGGTGTIDLSGQAVLSGGGINAGLNPDSLISINVSDDAILDVTDLNLGNGTLNQTGGQVMCSSWIAISKDNASGTYNISGGSLSQQTPVGGDPNWMTVGEALSGTMNVSGDAIVDAGSLGMIVGRFDKGDGRLSITGSNATVMVNDLRVGIDDKGIDTTAIGTLSWTADAGGISPIVSADNTEFGMADSFLEVDLSASDDFDSYGDTGTMQEILLIDNAAQVEGTFFGIDEGDEIAIGPFGSFVTAAVSYAGGDDGFDVVLQVMVDDGETLLGDINCDGTVDLLDVAPFVELLSTNGFSDKADINGDGNVDLLDVAPFIDILAG